MTTISESPNIALVQRFFVAYADHDLEQMREEILAPDADQHAADLFFWEVWRDDLRPLPERLRNG